MSSELAQIYDIGELVDVTQGLAINSKTKHLLRDEGLPLLRITDLFSGSYSQFVTQEGVPKQCIANSEELIYTRTGQVGFVFTNKVGVVHNNCFKVTPKDDRLSRRYLYWYLRQESVRNYVNTVASGSVQKDLNHSAFKTLKIPLLDLEAQRQIDSILSSLDDRITLLRETNATLEAIAQALFKSWFVDFDPVRAKMEGRAPEGMDEATAALFPDALEETELGLVPSGWNLAPLATVVKLAEGKPWVSTNRVDASNISVFGANGRIGFASEPLGEGRVIFLGKIGSCGAINEHKGLWWATNNAFYIDKSANQALEWCRQVLGCIDFKGYVGGSSNPYMPLKNFAHHPVICAPTVIQLLYEDFVGSLRTKIESNSDQAEQLATLRDTLLPRLISGQLKLDIEAETGVEQHG